MIRDLLLEKEIESGILSAGFATLVGPGPGKESS